MTELKNITEGLNSRLDEVKAQTSKLKTKQWESLTQGSKMKK